MVLGQPAWQPQGSDQMVTPGTELVPVVLTDQYLTELASTEPVKKQSDLGVFRSSTCTAFTYCNGLILPQACSISNLLSFNVFIFNVSYCILMFVICLYFYAKHVDIYSAFKICHLPLPSVHLCACVCERVGVCVCNLLWQWPWRSGMLRGKVKPTGGSRHSAQLTVSLQLNIQAVP